MLLPEFMVCLLLDSNPPPPLPFHLDLTKSTFQVRTPFTGSNIKIYVTLDETHNPKFRTPAKKKRALGIYGNKIDSMRKQPFVTRFRHFTNVEKKEKK